MFLFCVLKSYWICLGLFLMLTNRFSEVFPMFGSISLIFLTAPNMFQHFPSILPTFPTSSNVSQCTLSSFTSNSHHCPRCSEHVRKTVQTCPKHSPNKCQTWLERCQHLRFWILLAYQDCLDLYSLFFWGGESASHPHHPRSRPVLFVPGGERVRKQSNYEKCVQAHKFNNNLRWCFAFDDRMTADRTTGFWRFQINLL